MGKASMTDKEPPENDSILATETIQITIAKERFDRVCFVWETSIPLGLPEMMTVISYFKIQVSSRAFHSWHAEVKGWSGSLIIH